MRKLFFPLVFVTSLLGACAIPQPVLASDVTYGDYLINDPTLSYSTAPVLNLDNIDFLAMQAIYSSATISALSFDDGRKSTMTITVVSTNNLTAARININGYILDEGDAWTAQATASMTAKAISDAIVAMPGLTDILVSTWASNGVVYATATTIGAAPNSWPTFVSVSSITISGPSNGSESKVSASTDKITFTSAHGVSTGFPMYLTTVSGTAPTGLTSGTTYYAIKSDAVSLQLASSSSNALAGTAVNITAITGSGSFTLTPTAFAGTYSFKWQASNDNANWFDVDTDSVTYSSPGTTMWDGLINFKYLRLNFSPGTGGGLNLKVLGFGKEVR